MRFQTLPFFFLTFSGLVFGSPSTRKTRKFHTAKRGNSTSPEMYQLSSDEHFHFEILRVLSLAPYQGADIGETLVAANQITPGDFESYYAAFNSLADQVHGAAEAIDSTWYPVSARNALFRESTYYRSADFFLHGNWSDPRIDSLWSQQLAAFDSAIALLPTPGERVVLQAKGFEIPAIFFGSGLPGPRATLLLCNGYDGSQEEMYHAIGEAALQRGMNVITFEGPGQPAVRRRQGIGFIAEWEEVVSPVVDYALSRREVDAGKIGLWGHSFGGYLAPRAAAFDHRLAAVVAFDGLYSFGQAVFEQFGPDLTALFRTGNEAAFNDVVSPLLAEPATPTTVRWAIQQGLWSFNVETRFQWAKEVEKYTLDGVVENIKTPVFVGDTQNDLFFAGQAKLLAEKLGDRATYRLFETVEGAGEHCSLGASVLGAQVVLDWFQGVVSS
ncbi:hypothetical protein AAE478_002238 [Parahypoxylon ruwenzoriense]